MAVDIENEMETALDVLMGEDEEQTKAEKERFKRLIKASADKYKKLDGTLVFNLNMSFVFQIIKLHNNNFPT